MKFQIKPISGIFGQKHVNNLIHNYYKVFFDTISFNDALLVYTVSLIYRKSLNKE